MQSEASGVIDSLNQYLDKAIEELVANGTDKIRQRMKMSENITVERAQNAGVPLQQKRFCTPRILKWVSK